MNVIFALSQIHPFDERVNSDIIVVGFVVDKSYVRRCNAVAYGGCVRQMASELFVQVSVSETETRLLYSYNFSTYGYIIISKLVSYMFT